MWGADAQSTRCAAGSRNKSRLPSRMAFAVCVVCDCDIDFLCLRCLLADYTTRFPSSFASSFTSASAQAIPQLNAGCCSFCGRHDGYLLLTTSNHLLHKRCLQALSGTLSGTLRDSTHVGTATGVDAVLPPFSPSPAIPCSICNGRFGSVIRCQHDGCSKWFHPSCVNLACHFFLSTPHGVAPLF